MRVVSIFDRGWFLFALWGLLLVTSVAVLYTRHQSRQLFIELEQLNRERDELNIEWGKLRIEQSTWATHSRVEGLARNELDMQSPYSQATVVLSP